jgi:xylan 1,4-beta-xylosidase
MSIAKRSRFLGAFSAASAIVFALAVPAHGQQHAPRAIIADIHNTSRPVDRFFDFSVGSDYSGTLIGSDSQNQLQMVTDELGFRYIRFYAIFHDAMDDKSTRIPLRLGQSCS